MKTTLNRTAGRLAGKRAATFAGLAMLVLPFIGAGVEAQEEDRDFRVIVNARSSILSLPKSQISKLLLRQLSRWQDGSEALPVDLPEQSPTREAFNRDVHGRRSQAIASYWQRQIFSASQVPPPTLSSDEEVIAYVREQPGAIGYVSSSARLAGVREIEIENR
jgi:ABC-type phosphate transport system substrate-binding protein